MKQIFALNECSIMNITHKVCLFGLALDNRVYYWDYKLGTWTPYWAGGYAVEVTNGKAKLKKIT